MADTLFADMASAENAAPLKTIAVVGAGQMGNGIAHVAALAGYDVRLNDIEADRLDAALRQIEHNLARQLHRGLITETDMDEALRRIARTTDLAVVGDSDLIIESAVEKADVKKAIFDTLRPHLKPTAFLASNTSSISITRLAAATDRPERFIGIHFMNPVPVMKLVELIRGLATSQETYAMALAFTQRLGKTVANAEDQRGDLHAL
jgi:3-hydroxybutyryl-CoA dehydrogenase